MDKLNIFIIILIIIAIVLYIVRTKEKFNNDNSGVYNYFYQNIQNPYEQPLTKFFSNDIQKQIK